MSAAIAPRLDISADPTGTTEGDKKGREQEIRRILARAVFAAMPDHERERYGSDRAEGIAQEWVDRTLREISAKGWRIHKQSPVCSVCREPLEEEGRPWREYLASDELQEYLETDKQHRQADAAEYRAKLEADRK